MDTQQKLAWEEANQQYIRLYKEGMFWRAFEIRAFRLQQLHTLKAVKIHVKKVARNLIYVGFPDVSLEVVLKKAAIQHMVVELQEEKRLILVLPAIPKPNDESAAFRLWWEAVELRERTLEAKVSSESDSPKIRPLKKQVTMCLREDVVAYFQTMSEQKDIPYQSLMTLYLQDCVSERRQINISWQTEKV
jgi:hypothetical protein